MKRLAAGARRGRCRCRATSRSTRRRPTATAAASVVGEPERARATGWRRSATTAIRTRGTASEDAWRPATSRRRTSATTTDTSPYPRPGADGHLDRGLHPQHGRAHPRARIAADATPARGWRVVAAWRSFRSRWPWRRASATASRRSAPAGRVAARQPAAHRRSCRSTVVGAPRVVQTDDGPAVEFDGRRDGLLVDANPLAGLARFTRRGRVPSSRRRRGRAALPPLPGRQPPRTARSSSCGCGPTARGRSTRSCVAGDARLTLLDRAQHARSRRLAHRRARPTTASTMTHAVDGVRQGSGDVVVHAARRGPHVARHAAEPRVVLQGPDPQVRSRRGAGAVAIPGGAVQTIPLWPEGVPGAQADGGAEQFDDGRV